MTWSSTSEESTAALTEWVVMWDTSRQFFLYKDFRSCKIKILAENFFLLKLIFFIFNGKSTEKIQWKLNV